MATRSLHITAQKMASWGDRGRVVGKPSLTGLWKGCPFFVQMDSFRTLLARTIG